jgi:hypothetical protein
MTLHEAAETFVGWLSQEIIREGRGDGVTESEFHPAGRFWLGRLAPEETVAERGGEDWNQRLEPCAVGLRVRLAGEGPWEFTAAVRTRAWIRTEGDHWTKTDLTDAEVRCEVDSTMVAASFGQDTISTALRAVTGSEGLSGEVRTELARTRDGWELIVQLVNTSPSEHPSFKDTNLYECTLEVTGLDTQDYMLEALPDSFRYDRRVPAYGINCGIQTRDGTLATVDVAVSERFRPIFWPFEGEHPPDLRFASLCQDPLPALKSLVDSYERWGRGTWGSEAIRFRATKEGWDEEMIAEAETAADNHRDELARMREGLKLLSGNELLLRAFTLMNSGMIHASAHRGYDSWRPFQIGFLLSSLDSIAEPDGVASIAEVIWFPTGGGKTETYLGLLATAAFYDRLTGKSCGITAWSRFPLRMLSLQQTQRFADAMAGAELVRQEHRLGGDPFSVGFFVGQGGTPNRIEVDPDPGKPDPDDDTMPRRYQVLSACPFCHQETLEMAFNRRSWTLEHRCTGEGCPWEPPSLPFFVVDEEIFRFLPTIIVGTLDKAASIAWQAAMRGFIGAPNGCCSVTGHGFTYAARAKRPTGCLVPGCPGESQPLGMERSLFPPSFRLQDELHLLKDSLGAVAAHYEALLDHLQTAISGRRPKILASSATLTGYKKQVQVLYRRAARVFPVPGPGLGEGFWLSDSGRLMRRFVALAPRGVTLEFCVDRILTVLQRTVRRLRSDPERVSQEIGIPPHHAEDIISLYGTNVVYGNTLRDLDAVVRSVETQVRVDGSLQAASLTGRTDFDEVRAILKRLEEPEAEFEDRLHVIAASSMMSHGVDIDRLNVMVMLGLPLTAAEFIQATARVGRKWPALVFVTHKIAREREAGVYHSFDKFIQQGDRLVEPIPITRRSRQVLDATISGMTQARIYMIHEALADTPLTLVSRLREYANTSSFNAEEEWDAVIRALELTDPLDERARSQLKTWFERFFFALDNPEGNARFPSDLFPTGTPMLSMRDVEEQAPIHKRVD